MIDALAALAQATLVCQTRCVRGAGAQTSVLFVDPAHAQEFGTTGSVITVRKYSDAILSRVAGISTSVLCECPHHVAELIAQLPVLRNTAKRVLTVMQETPTCTPT